MIIHTRDADDDTIALLKEESPSRGVIHCFTSGEKLADFVLANDGANAGARRIKAQALTELGERQMNAIARNYYLSSAMYLLRGLPPQ